MSPNAPLVPKLNTVTQHLISNLKTDIPNTQSNGQSQQCPSLGPINPNCPLKIIHPRPLHNRLLSRTIRINFQRSFHTTCSSSNLLLYRRRFNLCFCRLLLCRRRFNLRFCRGYYLCYIIWLLLVYSER